MSGPAKLFSDWETCIVAVTVGALGYLLQGDYGAAASFVSGATAGFVLYGGLLIQQEESLELKAEAKEELSEAA